jgi:hypothetical protein
LSLTTLAGCSAIRDTGSVRNTWSGRCLFIQAVSELEAGAVLMDRPASCCWLPVVQDWTLEQYVVHARAYQAAGFVAEYMSIGSLCRRTSIKDILAIVGTVANELPGVIFHLLGVALRLLTKRVGLHPAVLSLGSGPGTAALGPIFLRSTPRWRRTSGASARRRCAGRCRATRRRSLRRWRGRNN